MIPTGIVISVNVGKPRSIEWFGRQVMTAIWKSPVNGPVAVQGVNFDGDDQADRRVHGGVAKSIYAYAIEDYRWWSDLLGEPLMPGTFGENLTLESIDVDDLVVGDTWTIGSSRLRVTQPRFPCFKLGIRMGDAGFVDAFAAARRFGAYFAIEAPGAVAAGDRAVLHSHPDDATLRIGDFIAAHEDNDAALLSRIAGDRLVPEDWREHAAKVVARLTGRSRG
jgi:MOSC domain-containing protein YiiM